MNIDVSSRNEKLKWLWGQPFSHCLLYTSSWLTERKIPHDSHSLGHWKFLFYSSSYSKIANQTSYSVKYSDASFFRSTPPSNFFLQQQLWLRDRHCFSKLIPSDVLWWHLLIFIKITSSQVVGYCLRKNGEPGQREIYMSLRKPQSFFFGIIICIVISYIPLLLLPICPSLRTS